MYLLALLVANSTSFRTAVGAANATEALNSVFYPAADLQATPPEIPPRAVITDDAEKSDLFYTPASRGGWSKRLSLHLSLDLVIPPAENTTLRNQWAWFNKIVMGSKTDGTTGIIDEMLELAGEGDTGVPAWTSGNVPHFNALSVSKTEGPWQGALEEDALPDPETVTLPDQIWHVGYGFWYQ